MRARILCPFLLAVSLLPLAPAGGVEPGVDEGRIVFGQSAAVGGAAAELGTDMRRGILAAFEAANRAGGVHRRRLDLITYDDRYEPEAAIENTLRLVGQDKVFALIGEVGTPTSAAAQPIASGAGVPFIAPFTGAEFLRDHRLPGVVNLRASYYQETEALVDRLTVDRGVRRVAVLFQDDSYGRAGLAGVRRALARRGMEPAAEATYLRNTVAVKTALLLIRRARPEAVIVIGAYRPTAAFVLWARKLGLDVPVATISFVGTNALVQELGPDGAGVVVSQVVPFPLGREPPVLEQYRADLALAAPDASPGFVSLEGYLAGRLVVAALERAGAALTRDSFLAAIRDGGPFDIGGLSLSFGPEDNQGSDAVYLTAIGPDGAIAPVADLAGP